MHVVQLTVLVCSAAAESVPGVHLKLQGSWIAYPTEKHILFATIQHEQVEIKKKKSTPTSASPTTNPHQWLKFNACEENKPYLLYYLLL